MSTADRFFDTSVLLYLLSGDPAKVNRVEPITLATHDRGLAIHERYGISLYDSMLVAAALAAGARSLYTDELQHGQVIEGQLRILDPFRLT